MDPATFYRTRQETALWLQLMLRTDDGLDYDDDVADPDNPTTVGTNEYGSDESDDIGEDDQNMPAHEEASASNQQPKKPCTKKLRICTGNIVVAQPSPDLPNEPLSQERQWRKRDT
ncbi:hypothetical protein SK128_014515 [Halocaridina rubra]|uniref:Uncharacterized protein n=1 Tax=Halocaridina rubra TaxID=373956 RepID=A0AAN8ZXM4_HALRR